MLCDESHAAWERKKVNMSKLTVSFILGSVLSTEYSLDRYIRVLGINGGAGRAGSRVSRHVRSGVSNLNNLVE